MQRGREYLDDILYVEEYKKEMALNKLSEEADEAYAKSLDAEFNNLPSLQYLRDLSDKAATKFADEKKRVSSAAIVQAALGGGLESKSVATVKALCVFSEKQMEEINKHYKLLHPALRKLMDAAAEETISFTLMAQPVFLRGNGHIYDFKTLDDLLIMHGGSAPNPHDQDKTFEASDILPCNTLLEAMAELLDIIHGKVHAPLAPQKKLSTVYEDKAEQRITEKDVQLIEASFLLLPAKHQSLFNIICRDKHTKAIMTNPVILPDGYIYDKTTANTFLKFHKSCPSDSTIPLTEKDIVKCYFVISVLDQMKENSKEMIAKKEAAEKAKSVIEPSASPSPRP